MSFAQKYATKQLGVLEYKGSWNASTNVPTITSSTGDKGDYYIVSMAGNTNIDDQTDWQPGDWIVFSGQKWQKIDNSETSSVINSITGGEIDKSPSVSAVKTYIDAADGSLDSRLDDVESHLSVQTLTFFENTPSVYADGFAGIQDSSFREGWYFKNTTQGQKINWYFYDGVTENLTLGNFSCYAIVTFDSIVSKPFLAIYTTKTGSGDAGSWYKSRIVAIPIGSAVVGVKYLMYYGQDPKVHPELPRLATELSTSTVGTKASNERVYTASLGSDSGTSANNCQFIAEALGVFSPTVKRKLQLRIRKSSQAGLDAEASSRSAADSTLQTNINTVSTNLTQETTNRINQDNILTTSIANATNRLDVMDIIDTTSQLTIYENSPSVYADAQPPSQDPSYRVGWYFKNAGPVNNASQNKINWYFYDGMAENISVSNFSAYAVLTMDSLTSKPFLGIYTVPTGSGDAASWYKSRRSYVISGTPVVGTKYLVYYGQDPKVFPHLPRLQLVDSGNSAGAFASSERIMTVALSSDSAAAIGSCQFIAESVGIYSPASKRIVNLRVRSASVSDLSLEIINRTTAVTTVQNALNSEVTRATTKENQLELLAQEAKDRSFHIGTQLSNTISDFVESVHDSVTSLFDEGPDVSIVYPNENGKIQAVLNTTGVTPGVYNTVTIDNKGRVIAASNSESGQVAVQSYITTQLNTTTLTSFSDIAGLNSTNLLSGVYKFTFMCLAQSTSTGTGIGVKLVAKTASISTIYAKYAITQSVPGTTQSYEYDQISQNTNVTSTSASSTSFGFVIRGEGIVRVINTGILAMQFRSEVADSAVSVNEDAVLILEKL